MNHVLLRHKISACFAKNMQIDQMNIFKQPCLLKAQVRISFYFFFLWVEYYLQKNKKAVRHPSPD